MNRSKNDVKRSPNPILEANILSKWSFWWIRTIFRKGLHSELEQQDLYEHKPSLDSKNITFDLVKYWEKEARREKPSLLHMIFQAYGWSFVPVCVLYSILEISIRASQPQFLGGFVSYFSEGQTLISTNRAYLYATGIVLCSLVNTLTFHPFMFFVFQVGLRIRLACSGLVYRKCLRSSIASHNEGLNAQPIILLSNDLPQLDLGFYFFHDLWKGPVEAIVFGYLMSREIGWSAIIGIAFILIFIPLQAWAAKAAAHYRSRTGQNADMRVKIMNEIIHAIQVIKMYAWEKSFAKVVSEVRKAEVKAIRGSLYIYAALQCTTMISKFAIFLSLMAYVFIGDVVTARKVFIVTSYFSVLYDSLLHFWPLAMTTWAEIFVVSRRTTSFLLENEDSAEGGHTNLACDDNDVEGSNSFGRIHNPVAIRKGLLVQNLSASWEKGDAARKHINDCSFQVNENEFLGIIGTVGSGKSSLLNLILGELAVTSGNMEVNGVLSYSTQESWVFEGTVKDNIIFVEKFDEERYKQVLKVCALERDIEMFPYGDSTIIGERGVSLSGGQKARVSLARAVYKKADIYLLDDPLSAVDSYVGKHILEKCILEFLSSKIRILVTHHVRHLKETNHLIVMEDGRIQSQGKYEELKNHVRFQVQTDSVQEPEEKTLKRKESVSEKENGEAVVLVDKGEERKEQQAQGSVKHSTYMQYFKTLGNPVIICMVLLLFIVSRAMLSGMDYFIARWATWEESLPYQDNNGEEGVPIDADRKRMMIIYTSFIFVTLVLYLMRTYGFFMVCLRISLKLHDRLFNGVTRAYMYFFNTNPSGRIINRFANDINKVDITLPQTLLDVLTFYTDAIAVIVIVAIANYWLAVPAIVMICLLFLARKMYIGASRSLKRLESMTRSPVYSHTNQTFHGLTTIRAMSATKIVENEFHDFQNSNTSAMFLYTAANRAFAFWTDLICVLYIIAVTYSFLVLSLQFYSGNVGLAITQSMSLVIMCQWGMRQTAELENQMTSVERLIEYADTPSEPPLESEPKYKPDNKWPEHGRIDFINSRLRYSEKGEYILKGLTFTIHPREKIGIVGRTGAGKSSIIQAIFRLAYADGTIDIDGRNIYHLGLHDLRSRISIIPQDPVLFSGTVRYNLDPFEEKTDEDMWKALSDVEMKAYVSSLEGGLNYHVNDGGSNFSMGQRQLVCLARAILRDNKVLIMDEATANVDPETDCLIQSAIRTKFADCTVLTIAHRLHTVMESDRVLVMDAGQAVEIGHAHELLQNPGGYFYTLVEQTGQATAQYLQQIAQECYEKNADAKKLN